MRKSTENAIKTLLKIDQTVTREERVAVMLAIINFRDAPPDPNRDLSVAEAASFLNLGRSTVWRMCKDGRLDSDKRGKKMFVKSASLAALKKEVA